MARKPLRPLIRSGGFYPSRKWTPLVYAGGYTTANGGEEPAPPPIEKTVTGNPIHITDALAKPVQALSIALEPIQDLHGFDNPWPAGGGKNLFIASSDTLASTQNANIEYLETGVKVTSTGNYGRAGFVYHTTIGETYTCSFVITGVGENVYRVVLDDSTQWDYSYGLVSGVRTNESLHYTFTATSDTFMLGLYPSSTGAYYQLTNIQLEKGDSQTTFAPYSNICPISGHTDADVTRTGVNQWDEEWEEGGIDTSTGQNISGTDRIRTKNYIPILPSTNYYFYNGSGSTYSLRYYDADKNYIGLTAGVTASAQYSTPSNAHYLRFIVVRTTYNNDISINYPSTDTAYHAYTGTTYPIPLGQTVYGIEVDAVRGKGTIKWASLDMGTANWNLHSNTATRQAWTMAGSASIIKAAVSQNDKIHAISSAFKSGSYSDTWIPYMIAVPNNNGTGLVACFESNAYSTNTEVQQALNGVQLVYELAEPVKISLTPTQVELLQGENNIWSDGEMTLVYLADGNASDVEALNILLGNRYVNNHGEDEPTDREALDILLGGTR